MNIRFYKYLKCEVNHFLTYYTVCIPMPTITRERKLLEIPI